jgi:uncharacterized protein YqeY
MRDRIMTALDAAKSSGDATRLCTLRLIRAAIQDRESARIGAEEGEAQLGEAEVAEILGKMIRQREDSIRRYEESGRLELAEQERREAGVIREFLPRPLTDEEMRKAVRDVISETNASSLRDMGTVMSRLKARFPGRMDVCKAGAEVRSALG